MIFITLSIFLYIYTISLKASTISITRTDLGSNIFVSDMNDFGNRTNPLNITKIYYMN